MKKCAIRFLVKRGLAAIVLLMCFDCQSGIAFEDSFLKMAGGNLKDVPKRVMKILIVTNTFPKLSETFVINQVRGLLTHGHQVSLYADDAQTGIIHEDVGKYNMIERTHYGSLPADLATYDIILCQFGPLGNRFLTIKRKYGLKAKLVTCFRGYDISRYLYQRPHCYDELLAEGDLFLANCDFFKGRLLSLGAQGEKVKVHYSAIDCSRFYYAKTKPRVGNKTRIITACRLVAKKGIEDTLYAVQMVIKQKKAVEYVIIGDGPLKKKLRGLAQELGIQESVTFAGWCTQTELAEQLHGAQIFVLASTTTSTYDQDAIPNALKEAMACGLPVVSTRHGGIPEFITHGSNGYLVNEHDITGLAERLCSLIDYPGIGEKLGLGGRSVIEEKCELNKKSEELEKILLQLLSENRP